MSNGYKIESVGIQFIVVDPWGEIVDRYPSEEEARQNIERCKREVAISVNPAGPAISSKLKNKPPISAFGFMSPSLTFRVTGRRWAGGVATSMHGWSVEGRKNVRS